MFVKLFKHFTEQAGWFYSNQVRQEVKFLGVFNATYSAGTKSSDGKRHFLFLNDEEIFPEDPRLADYGGTYNYDSDNNPQYYLLKKSTQAISATRKDQSFEIAGPQQFLTLELFDNNVLSIESITDADGNEYKEVDYTNVIEEENNVNPVQEVACAGGKCDII